MAINKYIPQEFANGEVLKAEQLNHIEQGLINLEADVNAHIDNAITIDDSNVGPKAWSSKNIVDKLCPILDENSGVVSCYPVDGSSLEVISYLQPGEYSGIYLCHCGKNLIQAPYANGNSFENRGITYTVNNDYSITINGENTTGSSSYFGLNAQKLYNIMGEYFSGNGTKNGYTMSLVGGNDKIKLTHGANGGISIAVLSGTTVNNLTVYPQLERGEIATAWEPVGTRYRIMLRGEETFEVKEPGGYYNWNTQVFFDGEKKYKYEQYTFKPLVGPEPTEILFNIISKPGINQFYSNSGSKVVVKGRTNPATSSKSTIDKLCPSFIEKGSAVRCEPVEGYPLTVVASKEATKVVRCGKNLFDINTKFNKMNGGSWSVNNDVLKVVGFAVMTEQLVAKPSTTYTISYKSSRTGPKGGGVYIRSYAADGTMSMLVDKSNELNGSFSFATKADTWRLQIIFYGNREEEPRDEVNYSEFSKIQLELGGAATTYERYEGDTFAPNEQITTIKGINTLYTDSGEITVSGKADPVKIIEKLTNAIIALGGNV